LFSTTLFTTMLTTMRFTTMLSHGAWDAFTTMFG
jgi:hypothetical protein